jgi:hypothetical protein
MKGYSSFGAKTLGITSRTSLSRRNGTTLQNGSCKATLCMSAHGPQTNDPQACDWTTTSVIFLLEIVMNRVKWLCRNIEIVDKINGVNILTQGILKRTT